ncbi:uncharacterized protein PGTG_11859 [Puccinia graminis f. sp. tritici CRL 75-36-700-3]|uniref:Uncharacterized protein n=1 Tax=Puccinia graminis f. sp. tritici (strain CRL 75-36-700-3 / race SCCL) TaxID=418459 RepID=E3KMH8_PUCGT|nr:uncharacterized protein PGTG_11859 [Puccinia graminis f. sp. tritici CRL 75-36-700-3]EFP85503.1 hypothetical protein PGTG_11859 [Puccinia graminis f. sp. tritici CRL 75-36-700-3]
MVQFLFHHARCYFLRLRKRVLRQQAILLAWPPHTCDDSVIQSRISDWSKQADGPPFPWDKRPISLTRTGHPWPLHSFDNTVNQPQTSDGSRQADAHTQRGASTRAAAPPGRGASRPRPGVSDPFLANLPGVPSRARATALSTRQATAIQPTGNEADPQGAWPQLQCI